MEKSLSSEEEYIRKLSSLQKELDENNELIEQSYERIKELELRLSLANSSFTKKKMSEKQEKYYTDRIAELENCLTFFNSDVLEVKEDEIETFLKRIIKLNNKFSQLSSVKRLHEQQIVNFEDSLNGISKDLVLRMFELLQAIDAMNKSKSLDEYREYCEKVNTGIVVIREIMSFKENIIIRLKRENSELRGDLERLAGSGKTNTELNDEIKHKNMIISSLQDKVATLEFELGKTGGSNGEEIDI